MLLAERRRAATDAIESGSEWVCPACQGILFPRRHESICLGCHRAYPCVAGLLDLRLRPDRYLALEEDRAKARRLDRFAAGKTVIDLAESYYAMTEDVDALRRAAFLKHLAGAEWRGKNLARVLPKEGKVLEVGCGSGGLLVAASAQGVDICGVDIALRWLVVARRRLVDCGRQVPVIGACAEALPWADGSFDAVVADSLLEHLDDPLLALREWARVLRPGGRLILWSPNRFSLLPDPHVQLWGVGWLPARWARPYVAWRRSCGWPIQLLSAEQARRLAAECRFDPVQVAPPEIAELDSGAPHLARVGIRGYTASLHFSLGRWFFRTFGPLWQLTAMRREAS